MIMVWLLVLLIIQFVFYFDIAEITCNDTGDGENEINEPGDIFADKNQVNIGSIKNEYRYNSW